MAAALCAGAALVLAVGLGAGGAGEPPTGGGGCVVGLNCGCIPHRTCPTPHARPGTPGAKHHTAPAPQNP